MHHKQQVGPATMNSKQDHHIVLPTTADGIIDTKKGTYRYNNLPVRPTFKFPQEARFCLGVAKVELKEGNDSQEVLVGKKCKVFDYSRKKLCTIPVYNKEIREAIKQVQNLRGGKHSSWVEKIKLTGCWEEDSVRGLGQVGQAAERVLKGLNIKTVGELKNMSMSLVLFI
jgi:hypothetical protein